ncbi:centrosomal protein of 112 kDa-like isoform X2 [Mercenaria mercenaria]|uniref:centrosomal protein of 112 kDa-like isoform X2 n=1 Tax=Mercenaria mercenaria TaxID=6596 RepID=UPI00234FB0D4|nr:centrosomal protein of 112 kDa-like isoform X2 [Mercenaria mercenaria]
MDTTDSGYLKLDQEFDRYLAEMKPHVLKLPHKTDRQKCAVWIKKLCEPTSGLSGRKNRNMYGQLMLHMLKRGVLEGPFTSKPQDGPLPTLPAYMSIYLEDQTERSFSETNQVPDWVNGELTTTAGSSLFRSTIGNPAAHSTWRSPPNSPSRRPHTALGIDSEKDFLASSSPRKDFLSRPDPAPYAYDDLSVVGTKRNPRSGFNYHSDDEDSILGGLKLKRKDGRGRRSPDFTSKAETTGWSEATAATSTTSNPYLKGITYTDDSTLPPKSSKEGVDMKVKMVEAKFHEEKLRLQQKHDAAVQKILDRKNAEIEDVKVQHRNKMKEMEDHMTKMEKKIQNLLKESQQMQDTKDRQIAEMKNLVEETNTTKRQEFEKKINDIVSEFEQEKFDMQKQHTKNIQEILDDTNARLQKMEREYSQQTTSTQNVIKELEARVQQLMNETENIKKSRAQLEKEKTEADSRIERFKSELRTQQDKMLSMEQDHQRSLEQHDQDLRGLQRKTESNIDFLKQEHNMAQTKAAETVSELESHIDQLKRNLKDAEEQRQRQIRELEQVHKQDKFHMDTLHEKQLSSAKKEIDQLDADLHKKIKNLEQIVRDREDEIKRLSEKNRHQAEESEKALSAFKEQVDKNQTRMFDDMKQQMARVESDLNKSKLAREKQAKEFNRQIDEEKANHNREVMELKMSFEQEKATMLKDFHLQKEFIHGEHEKETENLKSLHKQEVTDLERRMHLRQEKDAKKIASLDLREQELREEVVQSNQLRKQQLVELGLLREEEKQTMQREQETEMNKLRSEMEQQRLELQKTHSTEMEHVLGKTNDRLKQIEREYSERAQKSADTISELHATINQLRGDMKKQRESSDNKLSELVSKYDEEKKILKKHYNSNLSTVQKELESKYTKIRQLERQLDQQETDQDEKITHLKMSFEEKMRGLMPSSIRTELENTIESLKSQISSLQQKCTLLQEELDMQSKFPLGTFSTRTSSPIKSSS